MFHVVLLLLFVSVHGNSFLRYHKPGNGDSGGSSSNCTIVTKVASPTAIIYEFQDSYYFFFPLIKLTYFQAMQQCNLYDMKLLSIETPQENQFLYDTLDNFYGDGEYNLWTSGTSLVNDKHAFYWLSTGGKVQYSNWLPHQPDNADGKESCLHVIYNRDKYNTLVWNDHVCSTQKAYICELSTVKCTQSLDSSCSPFSIINN